MENITCAPENHRTFRDKKTGLILAIEDLNGHLVRYDCEVTNNTRSNKLFGADTVPEKPMKA